MSDATFGCPDLTTFCRLDGLGLEVTGQRLEPDRAVLAGRVVEDDLGDRWCRRCGCEGAPRDSVVRRLAHCTSPGFNLARTTLRWVASRRCQTETRSSAGSAARNPPVSSVVSRY